jgi:hypothetical protein
VDKWGDPVSDSTKFLITCGSRGIEKCEAHAYQITARQQAAKIADLEKERNDSVICFVDFCIEKQGLNKSAMEVAFMYWVKALKDQG